MRTARRGLRRRPRLPPDPAILITASCGVPPGAGPRTTCARNGEAESERCPSVGTLHVAGDASLPSGTSRACGDRNPVPDGVECPWPCGNVPGVAGCPRLRGSVPAWGDTHSVVRPRRRGTSLWTVSPRIEDVPFDRGLCSSTEGDGPGAVVWGRSTSWAQNAVPDGPGQPRVVVGAGQGRTRACRSTLPMWG